ncbi:MAG: hypothetical protein EOP86_19920 [Verrucomicrobiaceae bacterium]|nr:MAG: hypothetical protein EOP86_19920 [Verrucomicrobiaceae bacterium]
MSRILLLPLLFVPAAMILLPLSSRADTPLALFRQSCHELAGAQPGPGSQTAKLVIRSWVKGLKTAAALNKDGGVESAPVSKVFDNAEDPVWCATSLRKFMEENADFFPDTMTGEEILPLWWISVHPDAGRRQKEALNNRLMAMREKKLRAVPVRRFPAKEG